MELPIPTHLQQYFVPEGEENNEFEVAGKIQCSCGSREFEVWESNERHMIKSVCRRCGKEILLFDAGKHGWNGFVCHEEEFVDRTLPFLKYGCPQCERDVYGVTVSIGSQGKEDFMEECVEFDDSFSADDWVDGFEYIKVSLSCEKCGFTEEDWAVLETM